MQKLNKKDYKHAKEIKKLLQKKFGSIIEEIYCYGSKVKYQKEDADFDILIVTSKKINWKKQKEIFSILYNYEIQNNLFLDTRYFSKNEFHYLFSESPFVKNVKSYGVAI